MNSRGKAANPPTDPRRWAQQSGIVDDLPNVSINELDTARAVRDALFQPLTALIDDIAVDDADLAAHQPNCRSPRPTLLLDTPAPCHQAAGTGPRRQAELDDALNQFIRRGH